MSTRMRQIVYTSDALKQLRRIAQADARKIVAKVKLLADDPAALANNIKALKGSPLFRLRVGDYRVIYTADLRIVTVVKVGHRSDVYE